MLKRINDTLARHARDVNGAYLEGRYADCAQLISSELLLTAVCRRLGLLVPFRL